mmetsp:Transcript_128047/g.319573  ORF Transcript_128047/g.319573 Transcript_128047/m.319573 type:complete len:131 (+) Transcript_128047:3-395(+)
MVVIDFSNPERADSEIACPPGISWLQAAMSRIGAFSVACIFLVVLAAPVFADSVAKVAAEVAVADDTVLEAPRAAAPVHEDAFNFVSEASSKPFVQTLPPTKMPTTMWRMYASGIICLIGLLIFITECKK